VVLTIAGSILVTIPLKLVGTAAHHAADGSVVAVIVHLIVLAGAEINAETDIRPPATASATLKRPGARMADEIGQAKT